MISDHLKNCLPAVALMLILSHEGNECYLSDNAAELNNIQDGNYKGNAISNFDKRENKILSQGQLVLGRIKLPNRPIK